MSEESGGQAAEQPRLTVTLRDGQTCQVFADRMVVGSQEYPFADLSWASLVIDPGVPVTPGAPPPPALLLRLRDGREALLSPAEPPDAWRLLGAVHTARPDLRAAATPGWAPPPPPPPGYAYPYGYYARPAGSSNDTVLAGLSHLGVFLPFGWLLPLIVWLSTRTSAPYASHQAKQAFFWQLFFVVLFIVAYIGLLGSFFGSGIFSASNIYGPEGYNSTFLRPFLILLAFYGLLLAGSLINIIFAIIGAVKAFQGKPFHYPLLGW